MRDFDQMSNLPKGLREKLKAEYFLYEPKVLSKQVSALRRMFLRYFDQIPDAPAIAARHGIERTTKKSRT